MGDTAVYCVYALTVTQMVISWRINTPNGITISNSVYKRHWLHLGPAVLLLLRWWTRPLNFRLFKKKLHFSFFFLEMLSWWKSTERVCVRILTLHFKFCSAYNQNIAIACVIIIGAAMTRLPYSICKHRWEPVIYTGGWWVPLYTSV